MRASLRTTTLVAMMGAVSALFRGDEPMGGSMIRMLGNPGKPARVRPTPSKYQPHQGAQECARRRERG